MGTLRFFEEVVSFKIRRTFGFADYTFSGPYASEAYNSIRQSPLAEGIVLRINATEKSVSGISKRQKKQRILRTRRRIYSTSADSA